MRVGIAGPMSLELLNFDQKVENLPMGYPASLISKIINSFVKEGIKVVAFTSSPDINKNFIKETENLILCVVPQRVHAARYIYKSEREELNKLMQKYQCEVINALWSYEFALAALSTNIPTVVSLHDHALSILKLIVISKNNLATKLHWFIKFLINKYVLKKAKYLCVNSEYLYNLLPNKYKDKTRIINHFYSNDLKSDFVPIAKKRNIILSISDGFGKRKNIDTALKAFKMVREKIPTLEYFLIGKDMGPNEDTYNYAYKHNLHLGVNFLGWMKFEEVMKILPTAKMLLHPSREESFGMAVLESMALGTTVIGGKKSGNIPKLLDNGNAGIICDVNSPKEISEAILTLYGNEILNDNLRKKALDFVKSRYSEHKIIKQYVSYYSDILCKQK